MFDPGFLELYLDKMMWIEHLRPADRFKGEYVVKVTRHGDDLKLTRSLLIARSDITKYRIWAGRIYGCANEQMCVVSTDIMPEKFWALVNDYEMYKELKKIPVKRLLKRDDKIIRMFEKKC